MAESTFPSVEMIKACVPEGRRPYIQAAQALTHGWVEIPSGADVTKSSVEVRLRKREIASAICVLAEADRARTLQPPLPGVLGNHIGSMAAVLLEEAVPGTPQLERAFGRSADINAAQWALRAAVDYGNKHCLNPDMAHLLDPAVTSRPHPEGVANG